MKSTEEMIAEVKTIEELFKYFAALFKEACDETFNTLPEELKHLTAEEYETVFVKSFKEVLNDKKMLKLLEDAISKNLSAHISKEK